MYKKVFAHGGKFVDKICGETDEAVVITSSDTKSLAIVVKSFWLVN